MPSRIFRDDLLAGKRALVTGGGTGIGRATALELAALGADVAVAGRRAEPLLAVCAEIEALGRRAVAVPTDIRVAEAVSACAEQVLAELGGVDILVNNAGGHFVAPADLLTQKGWNAVINTNLNGTFQMTQEIAKRAMIPARSGVIVNIVIDMWRGVPGAAHAGAARAAVENLTKTLSVEWAVHGIRVNAIAPGTVNTGGLDTYPPHIKQALVDVVPLGRLGRPEEVAWMVAYLGSEAGAWVTGETLCIDGGAQNWGGIWNVFTKASK